MPDVWCQTPECQDAAFLQSADFSVPSCSGAYIQLRYPVWEMRLQHDTEHNATLFAFCYCTISWMVLVWVLCLVRWRHRAWWWSEGQKLVTTGCSQCKAVWAVFCCVFSLHIIMKPCLLVETLTCWFYKTALPLNALIGATPPAWLRVKTRSFCVAIIASWLVTQLIEKYSQ